MNDQWYPIATAPRDGTIILLGYLDKSGYKFAVRSGYWKQVHRDANKSWVWAWVCSMDPVLLDQRATHWAHCNLPEN